MTPLETIKLWLSTYPGHDILSEFSIDYTDQIPANGGIFPTGLIEIEKKEDILGNIEVQNQYNFGLYYVFEKSPGDNAGAEINADWIMDFQEWVQNESTLKKVPNFGNETLSASAQNGILYSADEEGTATYMVQLSIKFKKKYEVI